MHEPRRPTQSSAPQALTASCSPVGSTPRIPNPDEQGPIATGPALLAQHDQQSTCTAAGWESTHSDTWGELHRPTPPGPDNGRLPTPTDTPPAQSNNPPTRHLRIPASPPTAHSPPPHPTGSPAPSTPAGPSSPTASQRRALSTTSPRSRRPPCGLDPRTTKHLRVARRSVPSLDRPQRCAA
jgi:hypothetical protein